MRNTIRPLRHLLRIGKINQRDDKTRKVLQPFCIPGFSKKEYNRNPCGKFRTWKDTVNFAIL